MKTLKKIFNLKNLSSLLFYFSILTFIIAFGFRDNPPGGWYQQFLPDINGASIRDITFTDSLNGYIVTSIGGSNSYILKTTNGGDNWTIKFLNTDPFARVMFVNDSIGFTNAFQTIFKTTNAGENWTSINLPGDIFGEDMFVLNEDTIWLVNPNGLVGGVFRTTNGGASWIRQLNLGNQNPDRIYMYNERIGFIDDDVNYIRKTTDGGFNWTLILSNDGFLDIYFADSLTGWKNSAFGMKKTTDGGLNWVTQTLPSGGIIEVSSIFTFSNINRDTIWGTGGYVLYPNNQLRGILYRTIDGGDNWLYQIPDTSIHIRSGNFIQFIDNNNGWSYLDSPTGIHTTTGGDPIFTNILQLNTNVFKEFKLYQNYPNPFNPNTIINYELRITNYVEIKIYDINGREIRTLVNKRQNAGSYKVEFDGSELPSGVYFYSLFIDGKRVDTKKMVLVR